MEEKIDEIRKNITDYVYAGTILFLLFATLFVIFLILSLKRRQRFISERQQLQAHFHQELLRTQLEIQEQTFKTISQEIHDNIGQVLSLAKLNLDTVDVNVKDNATEKIRDAGELVSKAIKDLRHVSKSLNTEAISLIGLQRAIEMELRHLEKNGITTSLEAVGTPLKLDVQKELILFRIVQEALHNIIKHASASEIRIQISFEDHQFGLTIFDDGCGFDIVSENSLGSGLRNMKSRAELIGANLNILSEKQSGTRIQIQLPS